jgi:hypothetical protein
MVCPADRVVLSSMLSLSPNPTQNPSWKWRPQRRSPIMTSTSYNRLPLRSLLFLSPFLWIGCAFPAAVAAAAVAVAQSSLLLVVLVLKAAARPPSTLPSMVCCCVPTLLSTAPTPAAFVQRHAVVAVLAPVFVQSGQRRQRILRRRSARIVRSMRLTSTHARRVACPDRHRRRRRWMPPLPRVTSLAEGEDKGHDPSPSILS